MRRLVAAALVSCFLAGEASAAASSDPAAPDWPCVQRKQPELTAAQMWAGPLVEAAPDWRADTDVAPLVARLAQRRVSLEEAEAEIAALASKLGAEKDLRLTALFAGLLARVNGERNDVMAGIERFTRRQRALAERISEANREMIALRAKEERGEAERARLDQLNEQVIWDTRVFDERERSLVYVCEVPVLLEQRLFALARALMNELD